MQTFRLHRGLPHRSGQGQGCHLLLRAIQKSQQLRPHQSPSRLGPDRVTQERQSGGDDPLGARSRIQLPCRREQLEGIHDRSPGIFHRCTGFDGCGRRAFGSRRGGRRPLSAARPACLVLFATLSRRGRVDGTADPLLHLPQGPTTFAQRVKMVFLIGQRALATLLTLLIDQSDALGQAAAAITGQLPQVGQATQFFGPGFAVAVLGQSAGQPAQALLLDHHQARSAAKEDFVGSSLFDPRSGHSVEDRQQSIGLLSRSLGPATQLGHTGRALLEQGQQQTPGDR
ncbi:MAG TPA: hypothetical protein VFA18_08770 [Gemmataceae bacterium]|nr:hypothetical protein [Gemmataceae bacterium]